MKNVIVIGGGASGMMAASIAAREGKSVTLIEKNDKLGKKLFITGKGRCNVTNAVDIKQFMDNIPGNKSFLYSALYTFSNYDLMDFIESFGVKLKIERGNRVFPKSDKSSDIIKAFERSLSKYKVNIVLSTKVDDIIIKDGRTAGVIANGHKISSDSVIVSTGGVSYPLTGSTGDGYEFARKSGHHIVKLRPSLVPLETVEDWVPSLQGLSLKNVSISLEHDGKTIFQDFGEMLFTHFGLSGPIILSCSRYVTDFPLNSTELAIDLKPALSFEKLDTRILGDFKKYSRKHFENSLGDLLPRKLIPVIVSLSKIDGKKEVDQITKEERLRLVNLLKGLKIRIKGTRSLDEAIVTAGGVSVKEINPSTMESKLVSGLYFTGEMIDVDALTGGYNLQIAFSTGYSAGLNC
ncbi:MAG TPA: aminoacetone oxidase family FAD-binding enzyme [Clostridiaceae bacterium]|nr:aminoacetone oxidase family FAD-binding enzyme [Clostridiaceae bacterium]